MTVALIPATLHVSWAPTMLATIAVPLAVARVCLSAAAIARADHELAGN